jgi:hypothetical protein
MPNARGSVLLNTIDFVRTRYGPGAHARVLAALPAATAAALAAEPRATGWRPLQEVVAYMEAAQALFAPGDAGFFREIGRFAGKADRDWRGVKPMLSDLPTAARMASVLWRTLFDEGEAEVLELGDAGAVLRIQGFLCRPSLCDRFSGSLEGLLAPILGPISVERRCLDDLEGTTCCEYRLEWKRREAQP